MKSIKYTSLFFSLVLLLGLSAAQTPEIPHILNGEDMTVSGGPYDSDGEPYDGTVFAVSSDDGEVLGQTEVNSGNFEELLVSEPENGDNFNIGLGRSELDSDEYETLPIKWESGEVQDIEDFELSVQNLNANVDAGETDVEPEETVTFDASGSSGSTGIYSVEWDFDDGSTESCELESAVGELECDSVDHSFDDEGTYDVELTVSDEVGNSDSETVEIDVSEEDDGTTTSSSSTTTGSLSIDVDFSTSTDGLGVEFSDQTNTNDVIVENRQWSFGDGESATGQSVSHNYDEPGDYTVELTLEVEDGRTFSSTQQVSVSALDSSEDGQEPGQEDETSGDSEDDSQQQENDAGNEGNENTGQQGQSITGQFTSAAPEFIQGILEWLAGFLPF